MRDRIFYAICFGIILGVLLRSFTFVNVYFASFLLFLSFILILFTHFTKLKWGVITSVFFLTFSLGILRFNFADVFVPDFSRQTSFTGMVVDEPDMRENNQKLAVEVRMGEENTKILATTDFSTYFRYGDRIDLYGSLEKPENFITDQGKEFDYVNYLRKDGILYLAAYPKIEIISRGEGNKIKSALFAIKGKFLEKISATIPDPESILMGGLILGERASFDAEMRQKLIDTGTIHIVALSGYNVTIVAEWIMKIFSFLPQGWGFGAGILGILLFVIMAGGSSTAIRAGIMASLALVARATGRNYEVARGLVLAGVVMVLINPFVLRYDVSFQLSFIATVAVIFLAPKFEKYFLWVTPKWKLRDVISVTFAAYIFVLPFILYKMGNLSLVALPANILILPFIPFTMLLGFLTGFLGLFAHIFSVPAGYLSYFILGYELRGIDFFASLPFAAFAIPNFPLIIMLLIYAYFIYRLFGRSIKSFFTERF